MPIKSMERGRRFAFLASYAHSVKHISSEKALKTGGPCAPPCRKSKNKLLFSPHGLGEKRNKHVHSTFDLSREAENMPRWHLTGGAGMPPKALWLALLEGACL